MSRARLVPFLCFLGFLFSATATAQIAGLPQGLTCGLSYEDDKCLFLVGCGPTIPIDNACNNGDSNNNYVHTVTIPFVNGAFIHDYPAADGYENVLDGDYGVGSGLGYRHQELTAAGGGITDPAMSTQFVLPQGTACGFHHTLNSPGRTCMGFDAAQACPSGWTRRRAGDATIFGIPVGTYWVWCEYDDPNHYSARGLAITPAAKGIACGISHNAGGEDRGPVCMGYRPLDNQCPYEARRTGWIDQERPDGIGLGFCTTVDTVMRHPAPSRGFLETTSTSTGTFSGWAYDPNAPEASIFVDFYIDGQAGSGAPVFRVAANAPRPDVQSSFNISSPNHGYSFALPAQYLGSSHAVYAYGISLFGQTNPLLAQSPGTYSPPPPPPPPPPICRNCYIF